MPIDLVFKALSDPTRRRILRLLQKGERTAGDLSERFAITAPTMSHHFGVLKAADLVRARRDGQQLYYSLNTTVMQDVAAWALDLVGAGSAPEGETDAEP